MNKVECEHCGKMYSHKGIHTHIWRTHGAGKDHEPNQDRVDKHVECEFCDKTYNYRGIALHESVCMLNPLNAKYCPRCGDRITKQWTEYCSRSCGATHSNLMYPRKRGPDKSVFEHSHFTWRICEDTGRYYCNKDQNGKLRYRSPYVSWLRVKTRFGDEQLYRYRLKCKFKFNVYHYPEEYELSLLEKHGWYKASNRGNNLTGVSRDHIYSVKSGFDNDIDPEIIAHPANCRLMIHNNNAAKSNRSDITIDELLERIEQWEDKYSPPT